MEISPRASIRGRVGGWIDGLPLRRRFKRSLLVVRRCDIAEFEKKLIDPRLRGDLFMASPSFPTASSIWTLTFSWRFSAVTPSMSPRRRPNWASGASRSSTSSALGSAATDTWMLRLRSRGAAARSGGEEHLRSSFAATIRGGAMQLQCSPFATAIEASQARLDRTTVDECGRAFHQCQRQRSANNYVPMAQRRKMTRATPMAGPGASSGAMRGSRWSVSDGVTAAATRLSPNMNPIRGLRARIEILNRPRVLGLLL